jgi:hypothetical protein
MGDGPPSYSTPTRSSIRESNNANDDINNGAKTKHKNKSGGSSNYYYR